MRITIDTNPLVRFIVRDDEAQGRAAERAIRGATSVAVSLPCLCELLWVLRSVYRFSRADSIGTIEAMLEVSNMVLDRPAVGAGLEMLRSGGDFADGVIAYEGRRLGHETFASFDKKAVARLKAQGFEAELL